jgi:hypothetical protein
MMSDFSLRDSGGFASENGQRTGCNPNAVLTKRWSKHRMANRADITPEICRQLLRYEPETGKLFWRERGPEWFGESPNRWGGVITAETRAKQWNASHAGREAMTCPDGNGYLCGSIVGRRLLTHRVIWAIMTGGWPDNTDHINGIRDDNRWKNLRSVSSLENGRNKALKSGNRYGCMGIDWYPPTKRWTASIGVKKRRIHLGYFLELEDAIAARRKAERKYGFHPNHGRRS